MAQTKIQAEAAGKSAAKSTSGKAQQTPEARFGPTKKPDKTESPVLPPPRGAPAAARGADVLNLPGGAARRAQMAKAIQRNAGNARLGRLMGLENAGGRAPGEAARATPSAPEAEGPASTEDFGETAAVGINEPGTEAATLMARGAQIPSRAPTRTESEIETRVGTEAETEPSLPAAERAGQGAEVGVEPEMPAESMPTASREEVAENGAQQNETATTAEIEKSPLAAEAESSAAGATAEEAPEKATTALTGKEASARTTAFGPAPGGAAPMTAEATGLETETEPETAPETAEKPPEAAGPPGAAGASAAAAAAGGAPPGGPPGSAAAPAGGAGAAGAGGEGAGGGPPAPKLDTSNSEGMLQSLSAVPPSATGMAMEQVAAATPGIQAREKTELEASFPRVERPSGLPRRKHKETGTTFRSATAKAQGDRGDQARTRPGA